MSRELLIQVTQFAHESGFRVAAHAHSKASIINCLDAEVDTIEHFSYLDEHLVDRVSQSSSFLVSTYVATHRFCSSSDRERAEPEALQKIIDHEAFERAALATAAQIPGKVIGGSDSGTILNPHPRALYLQQQLMSSAGFSSRDIMKSMTSRSADALGLATGRIEEGYLADFVLFEENPVTSVEASKKISLVVVEGVSVLE